MSCRTRIGAEVEADLHMLGREKSSGAGDSQSVTLLALFYHATAQKAVAGAAARVRTRAAGGGDVPLAAQCQSRDDQRECVGSERRAILKRWVLEGCEG